MIGKTGKRLLALFLALMLAAALLPGAAWAADIRTLESGVAGMKKLRPWEIALLLGERGEVDENALYVREPDLTAPYQDAGEPGAAHQQAALDRLNALRTLAGLPGAVLDAEYSRLAQAGAYADALNGELSHTPAQAPGLDDAVYETGKTGASSSNIAWASWKTDLLHSVDLWTNDTDVSNIDRLGHRRWALNPDMGRTGFGYCYTDSSIYAGAAGGRTGSYSAMYAFDRSSPNRSFDFIGWPASGYFPAGEDFFEKDTAWSVTLNPDRFSQPDINRVKVTLRRESDGKVWEFSGAGYAPSSTDEYFNVETQWYGVNNCIIFRPSGVERYEGEYTVTVSGVYDADGRPADFRYRVEFFDLQDTVKEYTAPQFTDLAWDWERSAVEFVYSHGKVMIGTDVTDLFTFEPDSEVDLGTALTVMARLAGVDTATTDGNWARPGMEWGRAQGLTASSDPTDQIPRQELVYMLWVVAGRPGADLSRLAGWSDASLIRPEYRRALAWAISCGVLQGNDDSTLTPDAGTTRVQLAAFVQRAFQGGYFG